MKVEQMIQKSKNEKLPWRDDDLTRMHELIMSRVSQTKIQKISQADKIKNYFSLHWKVWAQSSLLLSGLVALIALSVDQEQFYLKTVTQMNNSQIRNQEIIQTVRDNPEILSSSVMINAQDSDFLIDLAYYHSAKKSGHAEIKE